MILEAKKLKKSFTQGQQEIKVLKGLDLTVHKNETIAILGKSGSGKSTLLNLLSGLDRPESGELILLDKQFSSMNDEEVTRFRARHMGIIFQNFHLLPHFTALENIELPLQILEENKIEEKAKSLLEKVGLANRGEHRPSELSGGEKQRIAVARALSTSPDIILADEPSGSLDEKTGEEIMQLIFQLVKEQNKALILVTHDQNLANRCSRKFSLDNGILHEII